MLPGRKRFNSLRDFGSAGKQVGSVVGECAYLYDHALDGFVANAASPIGLSIQQVTIQ
jgi:hypothetical protein